MFGAGAPASGISTGYIVKQIFSKFKHYPINSFWNFTKVIAGAVILHETTEFPPCAGQKLVQIDPFRRRRSAIYRQVA
jgi:hypothetical protein